MCGIFGAVRISGCFDKNHIPLLRKATDLVSHRGPDGSGHRIFDSAKHHAPHVFLGHRRLSIIDLSENGNQPMEDNGVWIVFNGEIFNYVEVREKLKTLGYHFTSGSDTEVILKSYHEWGPQGFNHFNGMWAFILFDTKRQLVIASRDRFSIKPLYYYEYDNTIYFSSELRQIELFMPSRQPNAMTLSTFLLQGIQEHTDETFYKNVNKVPPKTNFIIDLATKSRKFEQYWDYVCEDLVSEKEAIEKFQHLLKTSVSIRLRSDVEVGCLLSGGLDSSIIATIANEVGGNPIRTFSVVSTDKTVSEERFIDIMVKRKDLLNQKIIFDPASAVEFVDACLFHQEQPFGGASVIAQFMIYELIKKQTGIKVVLSGQGGDEALMGYLKYFYFYLNQLTKQGKYVQAAREVFYSMLNRTAITQFNFGQAKRYLPGMITNQLSYLRDTNQLVEIWKVNSIEERQINDLDHYSVPSLTHFEDRNSMAHSIESRTPFLDHKLVNFLVHLPASYKYKRGWSKYILRKACAELPEEIRWRRDKKGFTVPEDAWCRTTLREDIRSIGKNSALAELGILDADRFKKYFEEYLKGSARANSKEIFSVYVAEKWLKKIYSLEKIKY